MNPAKTAQFDLFSRKAQALSELAIFGSILLFCLSTLIQYGLDSNYQQQVQMEAFRKAQRIAYYKTGPGAAVSLTVLKDRPMPDPSDSWGFADRVPYVSGAGFTWDNNQSAEYVKHFNDLVNASDLPTSYFDVDHINSAQLTNLKSGYSTPPTAAGQNNVFGFQNARADKSACPGGGVDITKYDPEHTKTGAEYYIENVPCSEIAVMRMEDNATSTTSGLMMYPFYRDSDNVLNQITSADVNGDGKSENVIGALKTGGTITFYYLTMHSDQQTAGGVTQTGAIQIDNEKTGFSPGERVLDGGSWRYRDLNEKQGLIGDTQKTVQHSGSTITRNEVSGKVTSVTNLNANQTITHKIRLNKQAGSGSNDVLDLKTEYPASTKPLYNW